MHLAETYGKIPLHFEANRGQTDPRVKFLSRGVGYNLFLTSTEAVLTLQRESSAKSQIASSRSPFAGNGDDAVLRMKLVAANPAAQISGQEQLQGKSNYFLGKDQRHWLRNAPTFSQVRYRDTYPGIDLVYYGNPQQLEYDFVVAPGADPAAVTLAISSGSDSRKVRQTTPLRIATNGDLLVPVDDGEVTFHRPVVYQAESSAPRDRIGGISKGLAQTGTLSGRWVMKSPTEVGFEVAAYDHTRPLIIDPALGYSTYLGGSNSDVAQAIAVDSSGNTYVTGNAKSLDFPTVNPYQSTNAGSADVFVSKLDPSGSVLLYSTYIGGKAFDSAFGIAVDSSGSAYVAGDTGSTDYPVTAGAFQTIFGGGAIGTTDVFLTKLDPTGSTLVYSTFLGGTGTDRVVEGVAVDSAGSAYVTGWTTSTNFPTTSGAFQTVLTGTQDGFVTKFNASGSALAYSTLLGGSGASAVNSIVLDAFDNAFIVGQTTAADFPTTTGVLQPSLSGGTDAFVAELNSTASTLLSSTYLGGSSTDMAFGIALDSSGNIYVSGFSCSSNFPVTPGAFQTVYKGYCSMNGTGGNGVVAKINPTLTSLLYSTFIGGSGNDVAYTVAVDGTGVAHVGGRTTSKDFPTTPGAFQTTFGGASDAFLTYVDPTGSQLIYSTYFGGNGADAAYVLALDPTGNDIFDGRTHSTNFPTTPGSFDPTCSRCTLQTSISHTFVSKFIPGDQVWPLALNFGNASVGVRSSLLVATLSNSESTTLNISAVAISGTNAGDFAETNTCGTSLAAGASCSISVTLQPSANGIRTASLSVTDSAANSPQIVALSGIGTASAATLTPSTMTFAAQVINTSSTTRTATLTSTGGATLTISKIAATAPYSQTNNCGTSLAPKASCTINVTFLPTKIGTQKGSVTVTDSGAGSPRSVALTGTGTDMSFSPGSLSFGSQTTGTSSAPQGITMTNVGTTAVSITKLGITGLQANSFSQTNTCGTSLAAGANCTITVIFTPTIQGALRANVSVTDSGGGSPQLVGLTGTGT